jgi:hypothetical protein
MEHREFRKIRAGDLILFGYAPRRKFLLAYQKRIKPSKKPFMEGSENGLRRTRCRAEHVGNGDTAHVRAMGNLYAIIASAYP